MMKLEALIMKIDTIMKAYKMVNSKEAHHDTIDVEMSK
jgi:hypothetical protein